VTGIDAGLGAKAGRRRRAMTQWEYKIINIRSENYRLDPNAAKELNLLGEEGWELVSITSVNFKTGATDNIAMVFKRPRAG
jgi:selenocysteine lyase/cysteine desulfurase